MFLILSYRVSSPLNLHRSSECLTIQWIIIVHLIQLITSLKNENFEIPVVNRNPKTEMEAETSKDSYYYWMRRKFNAIPEISVERSALFMVLNRHYKKNTNYRIQRRIGQNK